MACLAHTRPSLVYLSCLLVLPHVQHEAVSVRLCCSYACPNGHTFSVQFIIYCYLPVHDRWYVQSHSSSEPYQQDSPRQGTKLYTQGSLWNTEESSMMVPPCNCNIVSCGPTLHQEVLANIWNSSALGMKLEQFQCGG